LQLLVSDEELARRRAEWVAPDPRAERGYVRIYLDHVEQAHLGADLDVLVGKSGSVVDRDLH
jgi:L-arabonate dehydrase